MLTLSDKRPLGSSGLDVTVASYGGGSLGNMFHAIADDEVTAILQGAWDAGVRYFDTAPFYGRGRSERRTGCFLDGKPRDEYVLSSKVGRLLVPAKGQFEDDGIFINPAQFNSRYDYSYGGVMRSYEDSLQRLGLDKIDILYVHDIGGLIHGDDAPMQLATLKKGGLVALEELRAAGDISGYGLGVNEVDACLDCLDYGNPDAFLLAGRYTLLEQKAAKPLLDRCLQTNTSLVVGGVFNSGILATGAVKGARYNYTEASEKVLAIVAEMEAICNEFSVKISSAAMKFPLTHPAVASVLLGIGSMSSLNRNVEAFNVDIPEELWGALSEMGLLEPEWSL